MNICIPVTADRGLESPVSGHFGSAPIYMLVDVETREARALSNTRAVHEHGACRPLDALAGHEIDAIVVGGIGAGALMKLQGAGIRVFRATAPDRRRLPRRVREERGGGDRSRRRLRPARARARRDHDHGRTSTVPPPRSRPGAEPPAESAPGVPILEGRMENETSRRAPDWSNLEAVFESLGRALVVLDEAFVIIRASHSLDRMAGSGIVPRDDRPARRVALRAAPLRPRGDSSRVAPPRAARRGAAGRPALRPGRRPPRLGHDDAPRRRRRQRLRPAGALPRRDPPRRGRRHDPPERPRLPRARRPVAADAPDRPPRRVAPRERRERPHHRRERDRQGGPRAGPPRPLAEERGPVRRGQLRGAAGRPPRERALRARARRVHRGRARPRGPARPGKGRDSLPRRGRGHPASRPGEAPPRPAGAALRAGRREHAATARRAHRRRHEPGPEGGDPPGPLPGGPLLPSPRRPDPRPAASREVRGRGAHRPLPPGPHRRPRGACRAALARHARRPRALRLAGQRPRAGERAGVRGRPRARADRAARRPSGRDPLAGEPAGGNDRSRVSTRRSRTRVRPPAPRRYRPIPKKRRSAPPSNGTTGTARRRRRSWG